MQYIRPQDEKYIMKKYYDRESFIGLVHQRNRFVRNDAYFSPETGKSGEEIYALIEKTDAENADLPHAIRKSLAFEVVLKNTRIRVDARDPFPAICMIDRPLDKTVTAKWRKEVFEEIIPEVGKKRAHFESRGIATMWPDYDHSVPVWERIFSLGFAGLLAESERIRREKERTAEEDAFFESVRITYEALLMLVHRLLDLAEKTEGCEKMAKALKTISIGAPDTFYEALLISYIYFMVSEHIQGLQVRSLSNFDRLYQSFYEKDMERGVSEEEIRTDLAYFFLQFTAIGNYWNQPVYLGGEKADGTTEINEMSYLFLDVYDKMGIYNPKIQIKVAESTPKPFLEKALDMIRRGHNCIVFVCDATMRKALVKRGATEEQARLCHVTGCYEYSVQGSFGSGMNCVNLLKPLEYTLHEGKDGVTDEFCGRKSPSLSAYETFDALYAEYKKNLLYVIDNIIEIVNAYEAYHEYVNPQPMLSATFPTCLEKGKDAMKGGALENGTQMNFGFLADVADSLAMIKKYVYDKKEISLEALVEMLNKDFEDDEKMRLRLLRDPDKYGNNRDLPDFFAKDISDFCTQNVSGRKNTEVRGGIWSCGFHVARMSYTQAPMTASSPNGRRKGEELAKNASASMGQSRSGATAAILSATKIDASSFCGDACLDFALHPTAVQGEDGLAAMLGLLLTFMRRGGHAIHMNVFSADTLREAQKDPEKYRDLQIRVCGWNVLFNNITKEEQDGFIRQAEALC
ncbi:MAG: hypothetical protein J6K14_07500 [Clostridia bacterium]|nr:hypothetical protein [Clostridia bacterium]